MFIDNSTASDASLRSTAKEHAQTILALPLDVMGNQQFDGQRSPKDEADILGPAPASALPIKKPRVPSGLPTYMASLYDVPLLTREQEAFLFRKMNYLKYKAARFRDTLDVNRPNRDLAEEIKKLYERALEARNQIIRANLRLVVSIAKRYVGPAEVFFELVSNGNLVLFQAVEKFDISLGNRFGTYATCAIVRTFARSIPTALRHRSRFRAAGAETFRSIEDYRTHPIELEYSQLVRESLVQDLLKRLNEREREIITSRFALNHIGKALNLRQIGATMGITKERVRQIQAQTIRKLRVAIDGIRVDHQIEL